MNKKVKVQVTTVKEVEFEMHPNYSDPEFLANEIREFSDSIFPVDSLEDMLVHAAHLITEYDAGFVEGIGKFVDESQKDKLKLPFDYYTAVGVVSSSSYCETSIIEAD